jgi:hypothetical protein
MSNEIHGGDVAAASRAGSHGLEHHGLRPATVHWNLSPARLYEESFSRNDGVLAWIPTLGYHANMRGPGAPCFLVNRVLSVRYCIEQDTDSHLIPS